MCCEPADAVTITPTAITPPPVVEAPPWHVDRATPDGETFFSDTPLAVMPAPETLASLANRDRILAVLDANGLGINLEANHAAVAQ